MDRERKLRKFLMERFGGYQEGLLATDSLADIVDSLGLFELVEFVEGEFGISVPTEEFSPSRFASIRSILELLDDLKT